MSQENVDLIVASQAAYSTGDINTVIELCASDVEAFPDASVFLESSPIHGRDELRTWLEGLNRA